MSRPWIPIAVVLSLAACDGSRDATPPTARDAARPAAAAASDGGTEAGVHDAASEREADGRAPYEALPQSRVDADGVRYSVLDGLLRGDDTLASARERLGNPNVRPDTLPGAEGEMVPGWTLYRGHPTRELSVYLDEAGVHPVSIVAREDVSEWRRADGVAIGMRIDELARLNGRAFDFYGFDWDMGGYVSDWNGGRLEPRGESAGAVRLCPLERSETDPPVDIPLGDSEFASDDPRARAAQAWVCELSVNLAR
jgi:hypothetical protein